MEIIFGKIPEARKRAKTANREKAKDIRRKYFLREQGRDIIKSSVKLRQLLMQRFEELDLSFNNVIREAKLHGMKLNKSGFSRYFSQTHPTGNILTQFQILWLTKRYGIEITFSIKKLEYDEAQCLRNIEKLSKVI